jgi:hypothetical protein
MNQAIAIPPGGGVPFGSVEFLGLSEHSPRLNVSVITMATPVRVLNIHVPARPCSP